MPRRPAQAMIESTIVRVLDVGGFSQGAPQPRAALVGSAAFPFTGAAVVAGTKAGPRGEMSGIRELLEVGADFGNDNLGDAAADARQLVPALQLLLKRVRLLLSFAVQVADGLIQVVDMAQVLDEHEAVVRRRPPAAGGSPPPSGAFSATTSTAASGITTGAAASSGRKPAAVKLPRELWIGVPVPAVVDDEL